jgi:F0F1-type ATP synthase assembly protein I
VKFSDSDIKAVARSRVSDGEGKKQLYWIIGVMVLTVVGVYLTQITKFAWGLILVAMFGMWWYTNEITKKQNQLYSKLLSEYRHEQEVKK